MLALAGVVVSAASFAAVVSTPAILIPLSLMTAWAALALVTSGLAVRKFGWQGPLDTVLIVRSLVKITLGAAALFYLGAGPQRIWSAALSAPDGQTKVVLWLFVAAWIVGFWCVVTGSAKLLLLLAAIIPRRRKSPVASSAHGQADFAGAAEASRAMQGKGRRSKMEGVKF